jgi:hypothetical protein
MARGPQPRGSRSHPHRHHTGPRDVRAHRAAHPTRPRTGPRGVRATTPPTPRRHGPHDGRATHPARSCSAPRESAPDSRAAPHAAVRIPPPAPPCRCLYRRAAAREAIPAVPLPALPCRHPRPRCPRAVPRTAVVPARAPRHRSYTVPLPASVCCCPRLGAAWGAIGRAPRGTCRPARHAPPRCALARRRSGNPPPALPPCAPRPTACAPRPRLPLPPRTERSATPVPPYR